MRKIEEIVKQKFQPIPCSLKNDRTVFFKKKSHLLCFLRKKMVRSVLSGQLSCSKAFGLQFHLILKLLHCNLGHYTPLNKLLQNFNFKLPIETFKITMISPTILLVFAFWRFHLESSQFVISAYSSNYSKLILNLTGRTFLISFQAINIDNMGEI